jgi:outer membrane protein TolC
LSKVDLNTDTTLLLRQEDLIQSKKIALNELLARDLKTAFILDDNLMIDEHLIYEDLKKLAESQNPNLQIALLNQKIAEIDYKKTRGARYPSLSLSSGYNFTNATNPPTGFSLQSNTRGFNYGLSASLNIFNGLQQNRVEKNAQLEIVSTKYQFSATKQAINAQLLSAYQNYKTNLQLIFLEKSNVAVAEENLNINLEKYKLGSIVPLELREAQRNFIDANARYANALFEAKLAEIALEEIAGNISI